MIESALLAARRPKLYTPPKKPKIALLDLRSLVKAYDYKPQSVTPANYYDNPIVADAVEAMGIRDVIKAAAWYDEGCPGGQIDLTIEELEVIHPETMARVRNNKDAEDGFNTLLWDITVDTERLIEQRLAKMPLPYTEYYISHWVSSTLAVFAEIADYPLIE